ncbi:MAG: hypothetical protein U0575_16800 [Phycisphaerales bacterium]
MAATLLSTSLAGVALRNPVIAAAGTCGYVDELADALDPGELGAIISKSITRLPREGNAPWRMVDVPAGMLNAIGLANVGLERFIAEKLSAADRLDTILIGSIAGNSVDDYVAIAAAFDRQPRLAMVELNVSCPNTADGLMFGEDPAALLGLLTEVRPVLGRAKMLVKLSPNVGDIVAMADAAIEGGADGLSLINTITAMAIDVHSRKPRLSNVRGGLSGPAVHPIAVRMVHDVYRGGARRRHSDRRTRRRHEHGQDAAGSSPALGDRDGNVALRRSSFPMSGSWTRAVGCGRDAATSRAGRAVVPSPATAAAAAMGTAHQRATRRMRRGVNEGRGGTRPRASASAPIGSGRGHGLAAAEHALLEEALLVDDRPSRTLLREAGLEPDDDTLNAPGCTRERPAHPLGDPGLRPSRDDAPVPRGDRRRGRRLGAMDRRGRHRARRRGGGAARDPHHRAARDRPSLRARRGRPGRAWL